MTSKKAMDTAQVLDTFGELIAAVAGVGRESTGQVVHGDSRRHTPHRRSPRQL